MENTALTTINDLLEYLSLYGGKIVSTESLDTQDTNQALASNRLYVNNKNLSFVWQPNITKLPETVEEVKFFERWYPLEVELPDKFKTLDWFFDDMRNKSKTT